MASIGTACARMLLYIFNALFVLAGLSLIIIGAIVMSRQFGARSAGGSTSSLISEGAIFVTVIGGIIFIISFLGCCGACRNNNCMLITFSILMAIVLLVVVAGLIYAFSVRSKIRGWMETALELEIKNYDTKYPDSVQTWNEFQRQFHCCGISNYLDWRRNEGFKASGSVPDSCCIGIEPHCGDGQLNKPTDIYITGCLNTVASLTEKSLFTIGIIAVAVANLITIGIFLSCCLAHEVRKADHAL